MDEWALPRARRHVGVHRLHAGERERRLFVLRSLWDNSVAKTRPRRTHAPSATNRTGTGADAARRRTFIGQLGKRPRAARSGARHRMRREHSGAASTANSAVDAASVDLGRLRSLPARPCTVRDGDARPSRSADAEVAKRRSRPHRRRVLPAPARDACRRAPLRKLLADGDWHLRTDCWGKRRSARTRSFRISASQGGGERGRPGWRSPTPAREEISTVARARRSCARASIVAGSPFCDGRVDRLARGAGRQTGAVPLLEEDGGQERRLSLDFLMTQGPADNHRRFLFASYERLQHRVDRRDGRCFGRVERIAAETTRSSSWPRARTCPAEPRKTRARWPSRPSAAPPASRARRGSASAFRRRDPSSDRRRQLSDPPAGPSKDRRRRRARQARLFGRRRRGGVGHRARPHARRCKTARARRGIGHSGRDPCGWERVGRLQSTHVRQQMGSSECAAPWIAPPFCAKSRSSVPRRRGRPRPTSHARSRPARRACCRRRGDRGRERGRGPARARTRRQPVVLLYRDIPLSEVAPGRVRSDPDAAKARGAWRPSGRASRPKVGRGLNEGFVGHGIAAESLGGKVAGQFWAQAARSHRGKSPTRQLDHGRHRAVSPGARAPTRRRGRRASVVSSRANARTDLRKAASALENGGRAADDGHEVTVGVRPRPERAAAGDVRLDEPLPRHSVIPIERRAVRARHGRPRRRRRRPARVGPGDRNGHAASITFGSATRSRPCAPT